MANSNFTPEQFKDSILQVKEHILAGDIFQLVLSQRFERRTFADPFEVYRALRIVNPSPYMIYLQVCNLSVSFYNLSTALAMTTNLSSTYIMQARGAIMVASSPEILTRIAKVKYGLSLHKNVHLPSFMVYSMALIYDESSLSLVVSIHHICYCTVLIIRVLCNTGYCSEQAISRNAQAREDSRRRHGNGEGFIIR